MGPGPGNGAAPYNSNAPPNYAGAPTQNLGGLLGSLLGGNSAMGPGPGNNAAPYYPNAPPNYAGAPAQNPGGLLGLLGGNSSNGLGALLGNIIH